MNKWIEVYMQVNNLKPNELFKLQSEKYLDEYCFDELGILRRNKNNHLEMASAEILGRLMRGVVIEKVNPSGRYIPRKGEYYWFIGICGGIIENRYNTEQDEYVIKHNLVFETEEEAEDYKWFLDQVDKYKKEFVKDKYNYCFYFDVDSKRLEIDYYHRFKYDLTNFGDEENIKEFISVVGEERIKKYMFNVWE